MLNLKNNFLWKMLEVTKSQNLIEKFDKEFWTKSSKRTNSKKANKNEPKNIKKELANA